MKTINRPLLAWALLLLFGAIALAFVLETPALRYAGSITMAAIGLGLLRRAFRVD